MKKILLYSAILGSLLSSNVTASASMLSYHTHSSFHTEHITSHYTKHTNFKIKEPENTTNHNSLTHTAYNTTRRTTHHGWIWFLFGWFLGSHHSHQSQTSTNTNSNNYVKSGTTTTTTAETPSAKLAKSIMTISIEKQLGTSIIKYNNNGAFIINNNQSTLNANVNSAPYATDHLDSQKRAYDGEALLNKTTRQYQNRESTNNGASNWKPAGFIQRNNLSGTYSHAYDRGHLLGYALIGGLKGFDASEHNAKNIATQTAWANEAYATNSTGQNYYEGIVRKALDQNKIVRYSVKDLYESKNAKVPSGAWIQAKSKDGSVSFNVFIPNVQSGLKINYNTGVTTITK
jgi:DNA-entry nuclease